MARLLNMLTSLHGNRLGLDKDDYLCGENFKGNRVGHPGADYLSATIGSKITLIDDFMGDVIADQWSAAKGSDAQAVIAVVQAGAAGGVVRQTTGDTVVVAESAVSLTSYLNFKAANGNLVFEARVKPITSVANVAYFVGLTDTIATGTLEEPITLSGTTFTTNATDAVGFVFDTDATTDVWYGKGVKNDVDSAALTHTAGPTADAWTTLRIELNAAGDATFYIDGVLLGTITGAVTASVALTPVVEAMARTTTSKSIDTDYILTQCDRV